MERKWCTVRLFDRRLSMTTSRTELIPRKELATLSEGLKIIKTIQCPKMLTISGISSLRRKLCHDMYIFSGR
jgi:hypothetical protein